MVGSRWYTFNGQKCFENDETIIPSNVIAVPTVPRICILDGQVGVVGDPLEEDQEDEVAEDED